MLLSEHARRVIATTELAMLGSLEWSTNIALLEQAYCAVGGRSLDVLFQHIKRNAMGEREAQRPVRADRRVTA